MDRYLRDRRTDEANDEGGTDPMMVGQGAVIDVGGAGPLAPAQAQGSQTRWQEWRRSLNGSATRARESGCSGSHRRQGCPAGSGPRPRRRRRRTVARRLYRLPTGSCLRAPPEGESRCSACGGCDFTSECPPTPRVGRSADSLSFECRGLWGAPRGGVWAVGSKRSVCPARRGLWACGAESERGHGPRSTWGGQGPLGIIIVTPRSRAVTGIGRLTCGSGGA